MEERFRDAMSGSPVAKYTGDVLSLVRNSIRIDCEPTQDDGFKIGESRLGGFPDLPPGVDWPTWVPPVYPKKPALFARLLGKPPTQPAPRAPSPHAFIAQFNLEEVAPYDTEHRLPSKGMLYFFFDAAECPWGYDPNQRGGWKTIYWNGEHSQLSRTAPPQGLNQKYVYRTARPTFRSEKLFPPWESLVPQRLGMSEQETYNYAEVLEAVCPGNDDPVSRLLGYPDHIQSSDMMTECQLASNGIPAGSLRELPDDPKLPGLLESAIDWQLLFQADCQQLGTNWGDGGRIYYWTKSYELTEQNLDTVWLVLQCY